MIVDVPLASLQELGYAATGPPLYEPRPEVSFPAERKPAGCPSRLASSRPRSHMQKGLSAVARVPIATQAVASTLQGGAAFLR